MNYGARRALTFVVGRSGSGKTTFSLRHLVNADFNVRFIWDVDLQMSNRLQIPPASTLDELMLSVPSGWVIFYPGKMFPGKSPEGFEWFCQWVWWLSSKMSGRKILVVDEIWRYCAPGRIPASLAECVQTGRVRELDCEFMTQHPNKVNGAILAEVTELVCFNLVSPLTLKPLDEMGVDPGPVRALRLGQFISFDIEGGQTKRSGSVFGPPPKFPTPEK